MTNWNKSNMVMCLTIPETYKMNCLKVLYLACATVITTSFIIECILARLVIEPSLHELAFTHTNCTFIHAELVHSSVRCQNKCSKDKSNFQCKKVLVRYTSNGLNHTVVLFENIATYTQYKDLEVSEVAMQQTSK